MLATDLAKVLIFDRAFDFQMKLVGEKIIEVDWFDNARKKDLPENKPKDEKDQALTSRDDGDRLTLLRLDMSQE